jgi:hypothetical protein
MTFVLADMQTPQCGAKATQLPRTITGEEIACLSSSVTPVWEKGLCQENRLAGERGHG